MNVAQGQHPTDADGAKATPVVTHQCASTHCPAQPASHTPSCSTLVKAPEGGETSSAVYACSLGRTLTFKDLLDPVLA